MGKSFAMTYLTERFASNFDLVISFCGSYSCSPELRELFDNRFDTRFMFDKYSIHFLETLRKQQEELKNRGTPRRVLLLFDDVEVDSETASTLGFFASRHRHFDVSMAYCSVRYSNVHKTYRASTDALLLFSTPMASDRKLMLLEYAQSPRFASFCMELHANAWICIYLTCFWNRFHQFVDTFWIHFLPC